MSIQKKTMKLFNWIRKYKYPIVVILLFVTIAICVFMSIQALKSDHSLDKVKLEMKLKEDARLQLEKERAAWQQIVNQQTINIQVLRAKDSVVQLYITDLNYRIDNLPKQYNEKAKAINNFSDADLQQYFNQLPVQPDNDY